MKIRLWAPLRFEIPWEFQFRTTAFGLGEKGARRLAGRIQEQPLDSIHIIFGTAGALRPNIGPNVTFQVVEVTEMTSGKSWKLPSKQFPFPKARLASSPHILRTQSEKESAGLLYQADLVDMEMGYLLESLPASYHPRLILLRGVFDTLEQTLPLGNPVEWISRLPSYTQRWIQYLRNMQNTIEQVMMDL